MDPYNIALIFVLAMFQLAVIARVTSAAEVSQDFPLAVHLVRADKISRTAATVLKAFW